MVTERFAKRVDCPSCGSSTHSELFVKGGYRIVRCDECSLIERRAPADDPLVQALAERQPDVERLLEDLGLGYKLHCQAVRKA